MAPVGTVSELKLFTSFLPAERASRDVVAAQHEHVAALDGARDALEQMPLGAVLLNGQRQIVFANHALLDMLDGVPIESVIGQRPGELLGCLHATESEGGCGTTKACTTCGAALAIQAAQGGSNDRQECRIMSSAPGDDLDLRVWTRPFPMAGDEYISLTLQDISHEKRREALERIFFHDVLNTAGGMQGLLSFFADASPEDREQHVTTLLSLSRALVDGIKSQRDLLAMERDELSVQSKVVSSGEIVMAVVELYREHDVARGRALQLAEEAEDAAFISDDVLVSRVVGNMVKNALEASPRGGMVTVDCRSVVGGVRFTVHNAGVMPERVQLQVFERSFSTKGKGRGLGTYSMKLLTERYLGGRVGFVSTAEQGTTFWAEYPERSAAEA